jgi:hypothetical protein
MKLGLAISGFTWEWNDNHNERQAVVLSLFMVVLGWLMWSQSPGASLRHEPMEHAA